MCACPSGIDQKFTTRKDGEEGREEKKSPRQASIT